MPQNQEKSRKYLKKLGLIQPSAAMGNNESFVAANHHR